MIIGIDLGTTNSLVGIWQDTASRLIANALGETLTPSVVSVDDKGDILVGAAAKERLITHPDQTASVFKRFMGSQKTYQLGKHRFTPEELSALVIGSLKADAEADLGKPVTQAVITVPAYFNDIQRQATKAAAELAGLKVMRLLNEPTAAAMAYGLHKLDKDSQFLVLDLGGGTFDVTLLDLFSGIMEVKSSAGDNCLGGEDFTQALIQGFQDAQTESMRDDFWHAHQSQLYGLAERAKKTLSSQKQATLELTTDGKQSALTPWAISEEVFAELTEPLMQRFRAPIEKAILDAKIRIGDLDEVILVGGATRMPVFRQAMTRLLGRFPSVSLNPDETIALGAAIQAGLVEQNAALNEVILTDVAPYSLGVETIMQLAENKYQEGVFTPIIERNTVIPTSKVHEFFAVYDNQRQVTFRIYQGEARLVKDNILLGEVSVDLPAGVKATGIPLNVRFSYDVNGLLEVDIDLEHEKLKKKSYNLVIQNSAHQLTEADIKQARKKLAKLKIHPRDTMENRALLAQAERLYSQKLGDERQHVAYLIGWFEQVLNEQDARKIEHAKKEFKQVLGELEHDIF